MEVKLDIPFEQLLRIIRQLTPTQRKKVVRAAQEQASASAGKPKAGGESASKKTLAFGGSFADMSGRDPFERLDGIWEGRDIDAREIRARVWKRS